MLQSYSNFAISFDPSLKIQASNKIHLSNSISHSFSFPRYSILAHHNSTSFLYLFTTRRNTRYLPNPLDRSSHRSIPSSHAHFLHIPSSIPPSSSSWISEGSHRFLLLLLAIVRANNETMKKIPVPRPTFLSTSLLYGVSFSIQSYAVSTSSYRVVRDGLP